MLNLEKPVEQIMTAQVITVQVGDALAEVEEVMRRHRVRHVPVLKGKKLVGIVSLTDLQKLSFSGALGEDEADTDAAIFEMLSLEQVMVANPVTIKAEQTTQDAVKILAEREFHALPVVKANGELVGIVSTTDLLKMMLASA